jgi:hypothetical protein
MADALVVAVRGEAYREVAPEPASTVSEPVLG